MCQHLFYDFYDFFVCLFTYQYFTSSTVYFFLVLWYFLPLKLQDPMVLHGEIPSLTLLRFTFTSSLIGTFLTLFLTGFSSPYMTLQDSVLPRPAHIPSLPVVRTLGHFFSSPLGWILRRFLDQDTFSDVKEHFRGHSVIPKIHHPHPDPVTVLV